MKHKHSNRILSRSASNRRALLRNLSTALLTHQAIITTEAKAKELRRFFEPLVTEAKKELTLHRRRRLLSKLGQSTDLALLQTVASQHQTRPGGYVRLTKLATTRHDAAPMVRIEIVK